MRFRKERVAGAIHEIVSDAIARRINDPRLAPLTTVSRVTVSGDLAVATVFLTVVGDAAVERRSLAALQHARGFVQHLVADQLGLRQCPELRFEMDETAKKVRQTMLILDENRRLEPHVYASPTDASASSGQDVSSLPALEHSEQDDPQNALDEEEGE